MALGGAVVAASSLPTPLALRNALAQEGGDAAILKSAIGLEHTLAVAYDEALRRGLLRGSFARTAELLRDQEREHAERLRAALENLGGTAPRRREPEDIEGLAELRSASDVANLAVELETRTVAAYYEALGRLRRPRLLETVARIMANEGQHLAVLRPLVNRPPVPDAFETGQR
jgi:rubrerythrin